MISTQNRGRFILLLLVFTFALPAIVAKVVLEQHWYQSGVSNKGELIEPYTTLQSLGQENPFQGKGWQLAYLLPTSCEALCQQQLHLLGQNHLALGKYQERVEAVVWAFSPTTTNLNYEQVVITKQIESVLKPGDMVIVDPLGQLVMRYPANATKSLIEQNKEILSDLRKLLKLSRVG
ncbi:hypothetical protein RFS42_004608 [Vibrio vulnificus]|uniref:hypothetical protein n=1 Tax=Vibrio vulnificus TaxID=672 RepID=UPI0005F17DAA|nr:hypothetical protein [Vibrio vulnificus]EJO9871393.1 hypothetical protein [Vibrio vulnificus]ELA4929501.1 hypothetical protein [Vibrio vulnificus]ELA4932761.1 hypothetical protein [Vibrio vulnificus]HAS8175789.1 hypothetical protein [Vibrio vulnificus]HAS8178615.1 hypothetical protein [Vibrio vulnificus]